MKRLKLKMVIGIVLAVILTCVFFIAVSVQGLTSFSMDEIQRNEEHQKGLSEAITGLFRSIEQSSVNFKKNLDLNLSLSCAALENTVKSDPDAEPFLFGDGMATRLKNGILQIPKGAPAGFPMLTEEDVINAEKERLDTKILLDGKMQGVTLSFRRIADNWYYCDWTTYDEESEYMEKNFNREDTLQMLGVVYGGDFLVVQKIKSELVPVFISANLEGATVEDLGFTEENLQPGSRMIEIGNQIYLASTQYDSDLDFYIVFLRSSEKSILRSVNLSIIVFFLALLMLIGAVVWVVSVQQMVRDCALTEQQYQQYHPRQVRRGLLIVGLLSALAIFASFTVIQLISAVQTEVESDRTTLSMLEYRLEQYETNLSQIYQEETEWQEYYVTHAGEILSQTNEIRSPEALQKVSDLLGGEYLTLYDGDGRAIACSADYTGLQLGTSADDPTSDFRRLNMGATAITVENATDPVTRKTVTMIGTSVKLPDQAQHGALILTVDPNTVPARWKKASLNEVLSTFAPAEHVLVARDSNGEIIASSDLQFIGGRLTAQSTNAKADSIMDYYQLEGKRYFGLNRAIGDHTIYALVETAVMNRGSVSRSLVAAGIFAVIFAVLALILTVGYTQKVFEANAYLGEEVQLGSTVVIDLPDGRQKRTLDPSRRWGSFLTAWKNMLPEQKARRVLRVLGAILILFMGWRVFLTNDGEYTLLQFLLQGEWKRGVNTFAFASILLLIAVVMVALSAVRFILRMIGNVMGTKGETVCRLLYNGLQYTAYIVLLFVSFSFLGIDTTALLAGVSLLSLAISLGSKDLIADVLAGLFIVFEGEFEIGDMVDVGGFQGIVQEIGIRSIKLIGETNDVKIISNHDVKSVINKSRLHSWVNIDLTLPVSTNLDELEAMFKRRLPEIRAEIPSILSGPYYRGVRSLNGSKLTVGVSAECEQRDYVAIQRAMNRRLLAIMTEEGYTLS